MEHIKIKIKGNIHKYAELEAEQGFCFYDADSEEKYYMVGISTPITDEKELARKYVVTKGDAEKLNQELELEREKEKENENG